MKATVDWWEIIQPDKESSDRAKAFYTEVFGWHVKTEGEYDYGQVSEEDSRVGGGIGPGQPGGKGYVTIYITVPSIDEHLKKIEKAGGKTVMPRTEVGGAIFAQFTDPTGNMVGLLEPPAAADQRSL